MSTCGTLRYLFWNLDRREAHAGSLLVTPLGGCSSSRGTPESSRSDVVWRSWASGKREAVAAANSSAAPNEPVKRFKAAANPNNGLE